MKKTVILYSLIFLLSVTYIFSFFKSTDRRRELKTALVNTKYVPSIEKVELFQGKSGQNQSGSQDDGKICIQKDNGIWFLEDIPVEQKRMDELFKELSRTRTAYKISDRIEKINSYGLTDGTELILKYYYYKDGESDKRSTNQVAEYNELIFGKMDFSQTSRYFMTGKSAAIYETDSSLNKYLSLSPQVWYDPYIISKSIQKNITYRDIQRIKVEFEGKTSIITPKTEVFADRISKLLELRHGGKVEYQSIGLPLMKIMLEKGDKTEIIISISATSSDSEYNVEINHGNQQGKGQYKVQTKISLWTYNKIKEIML